MKKLIDLHTHTNMSDGSMTPSELVMHAKNRGLCAVAVTDHDCFDGVAEAMKTGEDIGIEVVPGIELSAQSATETHILGYYIDINNPVLISKISELKAMRLKRNKDTEEKLLEHGYNVTTEDAKKFSGGNMLNRAHFAKAMVEKGYVKSVKEALSTVLVNGGPCYSKIQLMSAKECVSLIKAAGGMAFAAHLHQMKKSDEELFEFLKEMKNCGLCGIEGYYTDYTPEMEQKFRSFAKELDLLISGGTDFHADMKPHIAIGKGLGNMEIPYSVLENIKS